MAGLPLHPLVPGLTRDLVDSAAKEAPDQVRGA